jgi:hypothetical protein
MNAFKYTNTIQTCQNSTHRLAHRAFLRVAAGLAILSAAFYLGFLQGQNVGEMRAQNDAAEARLHD